MRIKFKPLPTHLPGWEHYRQSFVSLSPKKKQKHQRKHRHHKPHDHSWDYRKYNGFHFRPNKDARAAQPIGVRELHRDTGTVVPPEHSPVQKAVRAGLPDASPNKPSASLATLNFDGRAEGWSGMT